MIDGVVFYYEYWVVQCLDVVVGVVSECGQVSELVWCDVVEMILFMQYVCGYVGGGVQCLYWCYVVGDYQCWFVLVFVVCEYVYVVVVVDG